MTGTTAAALDRTAFSPERFRALAGPHLTHDVDELYARPFNGDHELNPDYPVPPDRPRLRDAAVLVPIVAHRPEATVIMTRRTEHLPSHAGQIAFPGGKIDEGDVTPAAAALREAEEEIGLDPAIVETLGYSAPYHTGSGFRILPVLALIEPGFRLAPNPGEVAEVFEVPLGFLMDPANHRVGFRDASLGRRFFYEIPYGDRYIWGVTAGIIRRIYERIFP